LIRSLWFRFPIGKSFAAQNAVADLIPADATPGDYFGARFFRFATLPPAADPRAALPFPDLHTPQDPHGATVVPDDVVAAPAPAVTFDPESAPAILPPPGGGSGDDGARSAVIMPVAMPHSGEIDALAASAVHADGPSYVIQYDDQLGSGYVMDAGTRTLLAGGPGDYPELGAGPNDMLVLTGDFSAGFQFPGAPHGIDQVTVTGDHDYTLGSSDADVAAGATLTIDAMPLGAGHHIAFDGSAESDGRFAFYGSEGSDSFAGGGGDDLIAGLGGGDLLSGGGGHDVFLYTAAAESTGAAFDTILDFDPSSDRIDLPGTVTGFHDPIAGGGLSLASFDTDLAAAMGGLGAGQAAWFAPDAGDLAGKIFLVVDANGVPGYQAGQDFVIAIAGATLADLGAHPTIFI
jgi:Ca2+-binding RTX toxin-like protein